MIKRIYGINIAVKDLPLAADRYERAFGIRGTPLRPSDFAFSGLSGVQFVVNGFHINLIASQLSDTSVAKFLEHRGEGVFLVSIEVDAINQDIEELRQRGLEFVLDKPIKGDFGTVTFAHPRSMHGVQFEVIQPLSAGKLQSPG